MKTNELATLQALAECCENGRVERMDWNEVQKLHDEFQPEDVEVNRDYFAMVFKEFIIMVEFYEQNNNFLIKIKQS